MENQNNSLHQLMKLCRKEVKKLSRKLEKQREEAVSACGWKRYRQIADSILCSPECAPKGTRECLVENKHTGEIEEVFLNQKKDARGNAELLYKKARKGERGEDIAERKVKDTEKRVSFVKKLLLKCEDSLSLPEDSEEYAESVDYIRCKAEECGLLKELKSKNKQRDEKNRARFRHFDIDGYDIYIGKNNRENDEISTRFAKPSDIWMHVTPHAGSHLIIKRGKNIPMPPESVLKKAASLAVWFSKAKNTSYADVHVTEARFVRKRRKSPPGQVIAERCKAINVSPVSPQVMFSDKKKY